MCSECSAGVCPPDANDGLLEVDVTPAKAEELTLPHAGFESDEADDAIWTLFELGKEAGKLMVLEVGSFLSLRTRLQAWV